MNPYSVSRASFKGALTLPPSKSHTMRALLLAALSKGTSQIIRPLASPDTDAMLQAISAFGATIEKSVDGYTIEGVGRVPEKLKRTAVDAGNSGQVLRFASAFYAQSCSPILVSGDRSLQTLRPCRPLISALRQRGAFATALSHFGAAPLLIQGPLKPGHCSISGKDSQPVSALLLSLPLLEGPSQIHVENMGERPWIDLTLDWMKRLGLLYQEIPGGFSIPGGDSIPTFECIIPGDLSALAFPLILGLITDSEITIKGVDLSDVQGDKVLLEVVARMGAQFTYDDSKLELTICGPQSLVGIDVDVNPIIDALPALAVLACFAKGKTRLLNAGIARCKESDRLQVITRELTKMGGKITEFPDSLEIEGGNGLTSAKLVCYHDHRIALALSCAAFAAHGSSELDDVQCVDKSFSTFYGQLKRIAR